VGDRPDRCRHRAEAGPSARRRAAGYDLLRLATRLADTGTQGVRFRHGAGLAVRHRAQHLEVTVTGCVPAVVRGR